MKRILVVDDDPRVLEQTVGTLRKAGYQVRGCANEDEAKAIVAEFAPEVLLTDVCLPRGDGLSLASDVRKGLPKTKIVLTSGTLVPLVVNFARLGGYEILQKPIEPKQLLDIVTTSKSARSGR
jgi:DNA-binding NtrC family response regulator